MTSLGFPPGTSSRMKEKKMVKSYYLEFKPLKCLVVTFFSSCFGRHLIGLRISYIIKNITLHLFHSFWVVVVIKILKYKEKDVYWMSLCMEEARSIYFLHQLYDFNYILYFKLIEYNSTFYTSIILQIYHVDMQCQNTDVMYFQW